MKPKGKCFAKKCEDCNWWNDWDVTEIHTGLRKIEKKCSFQVLMNEIPKIVGSMDGLQGGVNQARNASIQTREVLKYIVDNKRGLLEHDT